jgi:16S rRNA G966 N2-methylase RsmD
MPYCHCDAVQHHFDSSFVEVRRQRYKHQGPEVATGILLDALKSLDLRDATLLDIGAGIGTLARESIPLGIKNATLVESSQAYLAAAEDEARRLGYEDRVRFVQGDFVDLSAANEISEASLVTLDRVVCCYPDMERLMSASIERSTKWFAVSYPSEMWYSRLDAAYANFKRSRIGDPFRSFVHSEQRIDEIIRRGGFRRTFYKKTWMWRVAIYAKEGL